MPLIPELAPLKDILQKSWTAETSYTPAAWNPENPAWGQCAVTAVVVNDLLGGEIVWAEAKLPDGRVIPHYFNVLDDKEAGEVDFTREQFPEGTDIPTGVPRTKGFQSTREYILSVETTRLRYEKLRERVKDEICRDPT